MRRIMRLLAWITACLFFAGAQTRIPITDGGTLPPSVDNTTASWFPPVVDEDNTMGCGNATGIGWVFTYEMNRMRNTPATTAGNHFNWIYTYDFLNGGSRDSGSYAMFFDAWKIARENGIVTTADFTGTSSGTLASILDIGNMETNSLTYTRWPSGYDKYYRAMHCRVDQIDSFEVADTNGLRKMKQWLYGHGNGSTGGGIMAFTTNIYSIQATTLPGGTPEAGKKLIKLWGPNMSSHHAMAIVGYNDSIRFDFNRDGNYTNNLDISSEAGVIGAKDGKITMADWEIGGYKAANTWGAGWSDGNNGIAWAPYRTFTTSYQNGGITNNGRVFYITVKKNYTPQLALKISLTHATRNKIALSVGVAPGKTATAPTKTRSFERQFTYSGGPFPLCGKGASPSIEIGLDISDFLDSLAGSTSAAFFLVVNSKGGNGTVDSLSLMDYTSGSLRQTKSSQTPIPIAPGTAAAPATTYAGVTTDITRIAARTVTPLHRRQQPVRLLRHGIRLQVPAAENAVVSLVNVQGRCCFSTGCSGRNGVIDIDDTMPPGTYILTVTGSGGAAWSQRLLLK